MRTVVEVGARHGRNFREFPFGEECGGKIGDESARAVDDRHILEFLRRLRRGSTVRTEECVEARLAHAIEGVSRRSAITFGGSCDKIGPFCFASCRVINGCCTREPRAGDLKLYHKE